MMPSNVAPTLAYVLIMIEPPPAMKPAPVKYVQNRCPGIHDGIREATNLAYSKCWIPKIIIEIAKSKRPNRARMPVPGTEGFSLGRVSARTHAAPARARGSNARVRSVPLCRIADILEALKNHV